MKRATRIEEAEVGLEHFIPDHVEGIRQGRPGHAGGRGFDRGLHEHVPLPRRALRVYRRHPPLDAILREDRGAVFRHRLEYARGRSVPQTPDSVVFVYVPERFPYIRYVRLGILQRYRRPDERHVNELNRRAHD